MHIQTKPMQTHWDTIIIGAGMSGLAAGIRCAQFEQDVLVLDRHSLWGGLNSFYKKAGRRFDVGLHALTNYVPKGTKGKPLARILRQLRLPYDALELGEQVGSEVAFPGVKLKFSNDFELLRAEVKAKFPSQAAGFDRLAADLASYPDLPADGLVLMSRTKLAEYLSDPLLVDMLLLPLLYYGSPTPHDLEWSSFVVLWKSLYEEGFARPRGGVRTILDLLRKRYAELGGQLKMNAGVASIQSDTGVDGKHAARGLTLEDGTQLSAERILSSAGYVETMRLVGGDLAATEGAKEKAGRMTFVECVTMLDQLPVDLGHETTICFFNTETEAVYGPPDEAVDYRSGVICCPDNYAGQDPGKEGVFRLTLQANYDRWTGFPNEEAYKAAKQVAWDQGHAAAAPFAFDARPHATYVDTFTPRTIEHFTGHVNGAVYGAPEKRSTGETPLESLFVCGTDQGFLGIVGACLSGIAMANRHALTTS